MCPLVMITLAGVSIARHATSRPGGEPSERPAPGSPDGSLARR